MSLSVGFATWTFILYIFVVSIGQQNWRAKDVTCELEETEPVRMNAGVSHHTRLPEPVKRLHISSPSQIPFLLYSYVSSFSTIYTSDDLPRDLSSAAHSNLCSSQLLLLLHPGIKRKILHTPCIPPPILPPFLHSSRPFNFPFPESCIDLIHFPSPPSALQTSKRRTSSPIRLKDGNVA